MGKLIQYFMSECSGGKNANMPSLSRPCLNQSEEDYMRARRRHAWSNAEKKMGWKEKTLQGYKWLDCKQAKIEDVGIRSVAG